MSGPERVYSDYLNDMLYAAQKAEEFVSGLTFEEFNTNDEKVYAVIRALEVIGEAAKQIPAHLRRRYSELPWNNMAGMRDKLIHSYFGVNLRRVWETVIQDLPHLIKVVSRMLEEVKRDEND
jgi:uncharacterized protein with HEPN domain